MELSTSTNIIFERENGYDTNIKRTIQLCAQAGYHVFDFCFHDLTRFDSPIFSSDWREYFESIRKLGDSLGVKFRQGHAVVYDFCNPNVDHAYFSILMEKCIIGAEILGVEWLVVHPSTDFSVANVAEVSKQKNVAYFTKLVAFANQHHVQIAVENMWDLHIAPKKLYCTSIEELIDLVDSVEGLGICYDVEHAAIMQFPQQKMLELIGPRLKVLHVSDFTSVIDIHLLPYMGHIDWMEVLQALHAIHFNGLFNFEIHRYLVHVPEKLYLPALQFSLTVGQQLVDRYAELNR